MSRTVITAEWLSPLGGSERVVEHLAAALPTARVFTPCAFHGGAPSIDRDRITAAFRRPERLMDRRQVAAAMNAATWPVWGRRLERSADLVLASHHMSSHWTAVYSDVPHLAYVHTPARYAWFPELDDRASGNPAARALGAHIRRMDRRAATRVVSYAANSEATRQRIAQVWDRDARVIHPPTDLSRFEEAAPTPGVEPYLLGLSRFIPYKRLDFVIDVAEAAGLPAVLVGSGHLEGVLRSRAAEASVPVRVVTDASDAQVVRLLADATALVYPAVEDFGLVPVEAMAAGTPVLALDVAGTKETVRDGVSGYLLPDLDAAAWAERVGALDRLDRAAVRRRGQDFGVPAFHRQVEAWIAEEIG